jgi:hypothetical protein
MESLQPRPAAGSTNDRERVYFALLIDFRRRKASDAVIGASKVFSPKGGVMFQRLVAAGLLCALLAGCGGPTVDGTNEQTVHDSLAVMTKGMSKKDENKFRMSCYIVAASKGAAGEANASQESQLKALNGMSKDQITAEAAAIQEKNKQRRK